MNLQEYLNQTSPRPQRIGSVLLEEEEVRLTEIGSIGMVVHVPAISKKYGHNGASGNYFMKKIPYRGWGDRQLWTTDEDGNPSARSVFALKFDPK
jgi:hypothetical protein